MEESVPEVNQSDSIKEDDKVASMSEDEDQVMLVKEKNGRGIAKKKVVDAADLANGALASRFAPVTLRTTMDCDTDKSGRKVITRMRRHSVQGGSAYATKIPTVSGSNFSLLGSSPRDL